MQDILYISLLFLTFPLATYACAGGVGSELVVIRAVLLITFSVFGFSYFLYKWKGGVKHKFILKVLFLFSFVFLFLSFLITTSGC